MVAWFRAVCKIFAYQVLGPEFKPRLFQDLNICVIFFLSMLIQVFIWSGR